MACLVETGLYLSILIARPIFPWLSTKLSKHDKTSSLVSASYKMSFFLKMYYSKSVLFMNRHYYLKFELYLDVRVVGYVRLKQKLMYVSLHLWRVHPNTIHDCKL